MSTLTRTFAARAFALAGVAVVLSTPEIFAPGVISDANEQWRITFTPDGRTAYFAESADFFPVTRQASIHVSHLRDGAWTEPVVAPFSGTHSDIDPFISPDGSRMYFSSVRPANGATRGDLDLFMMQRTDSGWSEPVRLGAEVNTDADELYASESADGTLYFASGPRAPAAGAHWDIFVSRRAGATGFTPRERLGAAINTAPGAGDRNLQGAWEFNPEISPDGRMLVFTSLRAGGAGMGDLYVSHWTGRDWTPARNLGAGVNTASDEYHPTLSRDGSRLYFVRRIPARGDFFATATDSIPALAPPAVQGVGDIAAAARRLTAGARVAATAPEAYYQGATGAASLVDGHPVILYHVARAAAGTGRVAEALAALRRLAPLGILADPTRDSGFVKLWEDEGFRGHAAELARGAASVVASDTAFVVDVPNLVSENLTYDPRARVFYVGSMARRAILRVDASGRSSEFVAPTANIGQPLGMIVDTASNTLWAASIWPVDTAAGRPVQRSELLEIDLANGAIRRRLAPPPSAQPRVLNDLARAPDGTLYVTDSEAKTVWMLSPRGTQLEEWLRFPRSFGYPNGITVSRDGGRLFMAHQTGVLAIDRATRAMTPLAAPQGGPGLMGIDGLYATAAGVVGIQNSLPVQQVVFASVTGWGETLRVGCTRSLERRHPAYEIPTTGVVVDGALYYVANSQLRRLDARGALTNPAVEQRTVVLRLPLPASADCP